MLSVGYLAMGLIQLGSWLVTDRLAIQIVTGGSLVSVAGFGLLSATQGTGSSDTFHKMGLTLAIGDLVFAALYAILLSRTRAAAA